MAGLNWNRGVDLSRVDGGAAAVDSRRMPRRVLLALILALAPPTLTACRPEVDPPKAEKLDETLPFAGYVVDHAHLLSDAEGQALTDRLGRFQRETGHQMAVATVTSLHGEDIKAFSLTLAKRWGVGRRHVDDGILILIAPNEHKARIDVGLGLERALPNEACQAVMEQAIVPSLRRGAFGEGIAAGVTAIIDRLAAAEQKAVEQKAAGRKIAA